MKQKIVHFFQSEPAAGIVLMIAATLGIVAANSSFSDGYFHLLHSYVGGLSVQHWINDGLMAIFFLYVGLEVKRELLVGELNTNSKRLLPGIAALGGLAVPALIYLAFNFGSGEASNGWAIPAATDIAFALGVLAILGKRVPLSMKIFLTALAIMDDLAAIVIIALFYTAHLSTMWLLLAVVVMILLTFFNLKGVLSVKPYVILGGLLWFFILKSGLHATLAGVLLAFTIPLRVADSVEEAPLLTWEHALSNWVAFLIVPIFGFANAGVSFSGFSWDVLFEPVVLGIALGLFLGKQIGILGVIWLMQRFKLAPIPTGASWRHVYGVSLLCGIGFTMSLFIGLLAFDTAHLQDFAKVGVFLGSAVSGILGYITLAMGKSVQIQHQ